MEVGIVPIRTHVKNLSILMRQVNIKPVNLLNCKASEITLVNNPIVQGIDPIK